METAEAWVGASRNDLLRVISGLQGQVVEQHGTITGLLATVTEMQGTIGRLQARVQELEGGGGPGTPKGMPGLKAQPTSTGERPPKPPRKKRTGSYIRRRMPPTEQQIHAVDQCPDCATPLRGGWVQRKREVLEIPEVPPLRVIEHLYLARVCPGCNKRRMPGPELAGLVVGQQRFGVNLISLIATLREEARLPIATIQWFLATVYRIQVSVGTLVGALHRVAHQCQTTVDTIRDQIRAGGAVNCDETGWRENGKNGYLWTFSTPTGSFFQYGRRTKEMVDQALGPDFAGTVIADFYAAYDHYPGLQQRCWVHLLRDIHALKEQVPDDLSVRTWATRVHALFREARAFASPHEAARWRAKDDFEHRLSALCLPAALDDQAPHQTLCQRVHRYLESLFVFVADPAVPADNNAAERSLRHLVVCRKISGGTRSSAGTQTKLALASLFCTWRSLGLDPLDQLRSILSSPQP